MHVGRDLGVLVKTFWYISFSELHNYFLYCLFDPPGVNSDVMVSLGSMLGIIFDGIWYHLRVELGGMFMYYGSTCYGFLNEFSTSFATFPHDISV